MANGKRFSPKELAEWIYKTAQAALLDKDMGTIYYKLIGGGLAIVVSWSESDSYEYEENNPFMRPTKMRTEWVGEPYMRAYCLEVSLRIANSSYFVDDWEYPIISPERGFSGEKIYLCATDEHDKCRSTAACLSKDRTSLLKYH